MIEKIVRKLSDLQKRVSAIEAGTEIEKAGYISTETSTTTATMGNSVDTHICNGATDYTLTLPTPFIGKKITIINKNIATVTLSGTISSISATSILYSGESISLVYDGGEWV